jgi:RecA/RadA recombinase
MAKKKDSLTTAVSAEMKSNFNLEKFKEKKLLTGNVKFKEQKWIPFSKALQDSVSIPGAPMGHITLLRGHSNTGKTTALLELAINAQKMGILPVFIITEMKWSWEHAKQMGFQVEDIIDTETGEVTDYKGFFLYADRGSLNTIEDVAEFIADLLDEQRKGNLPYDLCFFWDSIGSIPCKMSVEANKNNPMWNAGAMSQQF